MTNYVSLAISDTMFPAGELYKESMSAETAQNWLYSNQFVSAANPSHATTFDALSRKFGIDLPIPDRAPKVALERGDNLLVFQANLPRLAEGERHSDETVENAEFRFSLWTVL